MMLWSCLAPIAVVPPTQTLAHPSVSQLHTLLLSWLLLLHSEFYWSRLHEQGGGFTAARRTHHALHHGGRWHLPSQSWPGKLLTALQRFITGQGLRMSGCWVLSPTWDICSIPLRGHHGREDRKNKGPKGGGVWVLRDNTTVTIMMDTPQLQLPTQDLLKTGPFARHHG